MKPRTWLLWAATTAVALAGIARADLHDHLIGKRGQASAVLRFFDYRMGLEHYRVRAVTAEGAVRSDQRLSALASTEEQLVVAGDFGAGPNPGERGLLLISRRVLAPFNFNSRFDTVLCVKHGRMDLLSVGQFRVDPGSVASYCESAVQTYPRLVWGGRNLISPAAMNEPSQKRVVLAIRGGKLSVLMFPAPLDLYTMARVLSLKTAQGGYEFDKAVVVSLGPDPVAYYKGQPLIGGSARRANAALLFND